MMAAAEHMRWMASAAQQGRYLHCPDGSHMAMYDDQELLSPSPDRLHPRCG
jgi:hypothetical protein